MVRKESKNSLRNIVYDSIINDIIAGVYEPMDIITESALIEKYGVSKSPVRDALIELCKEDILVSMPRVGYRLALYSDYWFESVIEFRALIEPYYLRKNWHKITPETIAQIESSQKDTQSAIATTFVSGVIEHWLRNQEFHLSIARVCAPAYFYEVLEKTLKRLTIAYAQHYWSQWENKPFPLDVERHHKVIEAMKENKPDEACRYLSEDIQSFKY